jgi:hypothetical protein
MHASNGRRWLCSFISTMDEDLLIGFVFNILSFKLLVVIVLLVQKTLLILVIMWSYL